MEKICINRHRFFKTSSCPVCPICEKKRIPKQKFLTLLPAPARRALENSGVTSELKLSKLTEKELLDLHGLGPSSIPILRKALKVKRLSFKG